jgi:hypothetical protein
METDTRSILKQRIVRLLVVFALSMCTNIFATRFSIALAHKEVLTAVSLGFALPLINAFNMFFYLDAKSKGERLELAIVNAASLALGTWTVLHFS